MFELDKAFYLLDNGYILHVNSEHGGGEIWKSDDGNYFRYRHFGSSAIETNKEQLKWLFETIFKTFDYVVFSNWNDMSLSYEARDDRWLWLFTDGDYKGHDPYSCAI